jgi:anti-sigma factor ChrR (cupin superfamily)
MKRQTTFGIGTFIVALLLAMSLAAVPKPAEQPVPKSGWAVDENGVAIGWPTTYSPALKDCMAWLMPGMMKTRPNPREVAYAECTARATRMGR